MTRSSPVAGCPCTSISARATTRSSHGGGLRMLTAHGGPGDDRIEASPSMSGASVGRTPGATASSSTPGTAPPGRTRSMAGRTPDTIDVEIRGPGMTLAGGDGDDDIRLIGAGEPSDDHLRGRDAITGAGHRMTWLGDGCAPHLAGITPRSVSRAFREGSLGAAARRLGHAPASSRRSGALARDHRPRLLPPPSPARCA